MEAEMETPGLLVLADLWYPGWVAEADGEPVPVLRVNHAIRGVVLPRGRTALVMRYDPRSFRIGRAVSLVGLGSLVLWAGFVFLKCNSAKNL